MAAHSIGIVSGIDPTGDAGFLLDAVVILAEGCIPRGVPTGVVAENAVIVRGGAPTDDRIMIAALETLAEQYAPAAWKIGLVMTATQGEALARFFEKVDTPVVLDPVIAATSGGILTERGDAAEYAPLLKAVRLMTPNVSEAEVILRRYGVETVIDDEPSGVSAAEALRARVGTDVLITGIGSGDRIIDVFATSARIERYTHHRSEKEVRGTGCALSSLIACALAGGHSVERAIEHAVDRLALLIEHARPIDHAAGVFAIDPFVLEARTGEDQVGTTV